jgi:hypothetical protein
MEEDTVFENLFRGGGTSPGLQLYIYQLYINEFSQQKKEMYMQYSSSNLIAV